MKKRILATALACALVSGGLGAAAPEAKANDMGKVGTATTVSAGHEYTAAITSDGALWTWGRNQFGKLGNGTKEDFIVPVKVLEHAAAVSTGGWHTAAITSDGSLWIWGDNLSGQFGNGTRENSYVPVKVLENVTAVSAGSHHTAAITSDGSLWTWGDNDDGQLGNGTCEDTNVPVKVLENVAAVSAGGDHTAAITSDGALWTWGRNEHGQLGNGTEKNSNVPVKVLENVTAVSAGDWHTAAITTDGSLWTWGGNGSGMLGNGTDVDSSVPVKVLENVTAVSVGANHTAAITTDGSLWTWGFNVYGALGTTKPTVAVDPVKVLENVAAVSAGYDHTAAVTFDGSLWTWGRNEYGQLGNGTEENSSVPVKVLENVLLPGNTPSITQTTPLVLPGASKYVPYAYSFPAGSSYSLTGGTLPSGMTLSADGTLSGMATEVGVFQFTVTNAVGTQYNCTLSVLWHGGVNVEQYNEPGYGFVETATDNGRIQNQYVTSVSELKSQTMHCEGAFSELYAVYLDARQLVRDVDYTAEEGSSIITATDQALKNAGNGTHVITAEFHKETPGGAIQPHYTSQTFEIQCPGLASKDVQVYVKGVPVIWTDSEPYINTDSRTMVPLRPIAESLGLAVDWNADTREAIFMDYVTGKAIYFPLGNLAARTMEGAFVYMDTAAVSVNGRSYAPVRFLAEYFGYGVDWEGASRTVGIQ